MVDTEGLVSLVYENDNSGENDDPLDFMDFIENKINKYQEKMLQKPKIGNNNQALPVGIQMTVQNIGSVSSENMELSLSFIMQEIWIDKRLAHGIENRNFLLPNKLISKIWTPDIKVQNSKVIYDDECHSLRIGAQGQMQYAVQMSSTIICEMQLNNFPMDRQHCALNLYSFAYSGMEMVLYWSSNPNLFNRHSTDTLSNFQLEHYTNKIKNMTDLNSEYKYFLTLEFEFKRMFMTVFFTTYLPAVVMVLLAGMASFLDPKSSPARVTLGITSVLTIATVIQGMKSLLPQVNYLTALDVYLWVCFFFVCVTLVEYIYLNYYTIVRPSYKNKRLKARRMTMVNVSGVTSTMNLGREGGSEGLSEHDLRRVQIDSCFRVVYFISFFMFNVWYWFWHFYKTRHLAH